jgi:hypothetical protein
MSQIERRVFVYSDTEHWTARTDQAIRHTRRALRACRAHRSRR